ncbi:Outer membrane protein TolC [Pedobacter sp. ok626]|uniref:TolC family protein n=1 Tax=Pedobacter sp. ok626 TaxID=1761882 RepID=UPI00087FF827|nr:TolC family protein [Pedobacter sp. ok626]SDJ02354.1 Outer membrane protein TolC [Pedobacter sp. ok626]
MLQNARRLIAVCILITLITGPASYGQQPSALNINEVYQLARGNYPLTKQQQLIAKTSEFTVSNAAKGYLPVLSINGQATYQSAVTNFPISIPLPGFTIPKYSKDQYKVYVEGDQIIYDGGLIKNQQQVAKTTEAVQEQSLEVELYQLYSRVNELFFGILLIDEQLKQNGLLLNDIQNGIDKAKALVANGVAYRSSVDELEAQSLQVGQERISLMANKKGYIAMLAIFIGRALDSGTTFERPFMPVLAAEIRRPELLLYDNQKRVYNDQQKLLNLQLLPKLGAFAQGGYGRPGLNMLSNNFAWYYLGGLKLTWNFGSIYTHKKQMQLLDIGRETIDLQKESFLLNTSMVQKQQIVGIDKYKELLNTDDRIIALRLSVKNAANAQLQNGVLNVHDYITVLNAEDQARQNKILHETQLLQALYNYQNIIGNVK